MPLTIDNPELEKLVDEIATLTGKSKVEVIRRALLERRAMLHKAPATEGTPAQKKARIMKFLREEVWPHVPEDILGKGIPQEEQDKILGYGPDGI
ncbi:MAG: type II toxin-antitoxin system VapB family antitoxin [Deinococcota bacterium]